MTIDKTADRIVCDLAGTGPRRGGRSTTPATTRTPVLRSGWPASCATGRVPERAAELAQRGCAVLELLLPAPARWVTPEFPAPDQRPQLPDPAPAGRFSPAASPGGGRRMPVARRPSASGASTAATATAAGTAAGGAGRRLRAAPTRTVRDAIHIVPTPRPAGRVRRDRFPVLIDAAGAGDRLGRPGRRARPGYDSASGCCGTPRSSPRRPGPGRCYGWPGARPDCRRGLGRRAAAAGA